MNNSLIYLEVSLEKAKRLGQSMAKDLFWKEKESLADTLHGYLGALRQRDVFEAYLIELYPSEPLNETKGPIAAELDSLGYELIPNSLLVKITQIHKDKIDLEKLAEELEDQFGLGTIIN